MKRDKLIHLQYCFAFNSAGLQ